jgi:hypothetical protein
MGLRIGLDMVENEENRFLRRESNPTSPVIQPVA